ncbi:N-acetylneuraminate synthase family protein [Delftia acidovorans]|uniref:N-acetylneuraminate synthase family protein n=1 Tax=Delftia acidovorans TaxID=80866 RepID=UPI0018D85175|nr:N-acetylneuraminate synthase family protein [Delftia acidovorans]QPR35832.1 N-acetylneuraminate synthase family protein [Delftia acidovorans]
MGNFSSQIENIVSTYSDDNIFILGKGSSADLVDTGLLKKSLIIAVNDAEQICPADITVFREEWAGDAIVAQGCRSHAYVTSLPGFAPAGRKVIHVPHVPLTQESSELLMQRFMSVPVVIEDILLLTALKIAREVAGIRRRRQNVYFVGFDFDASAGYSKSIAHDYSPQGEEQKSMRISVQEFYFINALYFLRDSNVRMLHVGSRPFSALTPQDLNQSLGKASSGRNGYEVAIVAELTTNHFGDRGRLERMVRASKAAGADLVKVQKRDVQSFYTREQLSSPYVSPFGKTFADYRHQIELGREDFCYLDQLCRSLDMGWFASVLDEKSFHFMLEMDSEMPMVKLPSTISEHHDYLKYVAKNYRGAVVLSTGMTGADYEQFVLETFKSCERLYLLQCNSAYPTPLEDCNVAVVQRYREMARADPRIIPGYSSHDMGWKASALAVAAGARMVEKHVKMGNTEWAHFDAVAVDLSTPAFKDYVDHIREAEMILGSGVKKINQSEHHKYFTKNTA